MTMKSKSMSKTLAQNASIPYFLGLFKVVGFKCEGCKFKGGFNLEPSKSLGVWLSNGKILTLHLCEECTKHVAIHGQLKRKKENQNCSKSKNETVQVNE